MRLIVLAAALIMAAPAHAQSAKNASNASKQTSIAIGAIGESGLKATSGVVAIPLGAIAMTSSAVGFAANASGQTDIGRGFSNAAAGATKGAKALVDFSNSPLTVTDEVIVGRHPQAAPAVPFKAAQ